MKRPGARKSRKREGSKVADLEKRLAEALEQQAATSEILRVIAASPANAQPVFDMIAANAVNVCEATDAVINRRDGDHMLRVAHSGPIPLVLPPVRRLTRDNSAGRAILDCRPFHVHDILAAEAIQEFPDNTPVSKALWRTTLSVPLVRDGVGIGVITVRRAEVRPFTEQQVALLQTFADQAVIAIENVRLFNATQEALEQQMATSEILGVISQSPTDVQPVFDTIAARAKRLCDARECAVFRFDGELIHLVAQADTDAAWAKALRSAFPRPPDRGSITGRAIQTRSLVHIPDVQADPEFELTEAARGSSIRSTLSVPMIREGEVIGVITVDRRDPKPFLDKQIGLVKTFADQAVIAIENVRLFKELEARNKDLTESLEQQTATSEILRVISSSPTDLALVFETILANASRLSGANLGALWRFDGEQMIGAAHYNASPEFAHRIMREPLKPGRQGPARQAALERRVVHVADMTIEPGYAPVLLQFERARTVLSVPLLREDMLVGVMAMWRREVQPFTEQQIALVQTFANQAVIAIENVRLFTELEASNKHLTDALDKQTATSDVLRVISRSQTDVQPVFEAILTSAVRLLGAYAGALTRVVDNQIELAAFTQTDDAGAAALRAGYPQSLHSELPHAQAIRDRAPLNIADAQTDQRWPEGEHARARVRGFRSRVLVPLLRQDEAIGAISLTRREPGGFNADEISLLQTFADQAVIAIENARLLTALQARTQELTRSVEQLTALGEVGRAVSSTLDLETVLITIVSRAVELSGLDGGVVFEYDEATEEFVHRVATEVAAGLAEARRATRVRKGEGVVGQTALTLEPAQVADITVPGAYESRLRENLIASGIRAVLAVPMVREGELIGCLVVSRNRPGEFTADTIELLRTFATQSALAIQNARLFREIEIKSRELEAASRHKSEFLANMSHELRTPLNAIIGFSEVLSERLFGELNEKQDEYMKDIHASGQHLLSLINDILDLSKIEAGRMELELTDFDLPTAIDNALTLVRERAGRRCIALHLSVDKRLGQMRADERKIRQVVLNLLSNAIKFTPEGGRIDVAAAPRNEFVEVSVSDTGIGIAPEDREAVFEEFRQVGTAAKKVEGTGLGLALSRKFIELHGGRIWVQSQVGIGSTFTFSIPVRRADQVIE